MYCYRILTIVAACLCMFTTLHAASGPERSLPGRIQPAPGEQMGIGDAGPIATLPDTVSVVPSPDRVATSSHARDHVAPAARIHAPLQKLLRRDRQTSHPAQDPTTQRHGWISWVALTAGVLSIAAMLTAILVGILLWEYLPVLVLIWALGAIIASVFGAVALGILTIKHRRIGIAGFVLGVSSLALPFLILIGLIFYAIMTE